MRRLSYTMRNLFRVSSIGSFAVFILNVLIMLVILYAAFAGDPRGYLLLGLIFVLSILLSLTPIGQGALCLVCGAGRITRPDMRERILPLAMEVFEKARQEEPLMPARIHVRVISEPDPNAYAIGINTIGVTEGLLSLSDSQIQGILAHEMGHLALQHTLIQILFGPGNIFMTAMMPIFGFAALTAASIGKMGSLPGMIGFLFSGMSGLFLYCCFLLSAMISFFRFCWTRIAAFFLRGSSLAADFEADDFACRIGYGRELAEALDLMTMAPPRSSYLRTLKSAHPDSADRIGRLQALGAGCSG